jgi:diacylglycerol kinase (ATP)
MKVTVIRNPVAGGANAWPATDRALSAVFPQYTLVETRPHQTASQVRTALERPVDLILAIGGDGTVGQVVDGILTSAHPDTTFAFLPGGTGSDFSRNFKFPSDITARLRAIADAQPRRIDVGLLQKRSMGHGDGPEWSHERHFINIASLGVSGAIVTGMDAARGTSRLPHSLHYRLISLNHILRHPGHGLRLVVDGGQVYAGLILVAAIANGSWFGGGLHASPAARVDDGDLNLVYAVDRGAFGNLKTFMAFAAERHVNHSKIHHCTGKVIEMEPLQQAISMEADGELVQAGLSKNDQAFRISVLPQALSVRLPDSWS